jgi:hypothetical protein
MIAWRGGTRSSINHRLERPWVTNQAVLKSKEFT